ncbi:MAG TPA: hypothetical protein EYP43_00355, partial [Thermoplasmata archaeon]|nr:hypothetical protein [Thermoplasmata archaeon]
MSIEERAEELDSHGMLEAAFNLPDQMEWALGRDVYIDPFEVSNIVIAGMGGSAIGGDIVKACTASTLEVPLEPWRGFNLPAYVGKGTLLVAVSYSGNTRETLSMLEYGIARGATVVGISSGGRMTDMMEDLGLPCIVIPKAPAPRAAIGYLTVPIFRILETLGLVTISPDLRRAVERLREVATLYRPDYDNGNLPLEIATLLAGKFPVIYAPDAYAPAARRWMTQLNEVSKVLAHWGTIPEIAHNEIVGWDVGPGGNEHVILLDGDLSGDL